MDCEKFEANLIDELYEELDELTSAAVKRHVAGCARCASILGGLRATRRVAVLPMVEPSLDLEDRILAAARSAQKVDPIGRRLSRAISLAGSWAMRPQTAMAAVFILMVGSSLLFVRRGRVAATDSVTVTAQGQPAPPGAVANEEPDPLDSKQAAAAHGIPAPRPAAPLATAPAAAAASASPSPSEEPLAFDDSRRAVLPKSRSMSTSKGGGYDGDPFSSEGSSRGAQNATAPAGAPIAQAAPPPPPAAPLPSDLDKVASNQAPSAWANSSDAERSGGGVQGQGALKKSAGPSADLQAANATRDTAGCGVAVEQYDRIANQSWGTSDGYDATFAAGECYRALGKNDLAQARYQQLLTVTKYSSLASGRIASMSGPSQVLATKATRKSAPAAKPAAPAQQPSQAPTAPNPSASPPARQQGL